MHVDVVVHDPHGVTETLKAVEFLPLGGLSLVHFELDILPNIIRAASKNKHECANKECGVLISSKRFLSARLIWSLDPVPSAIAMAAQAPSILESTLV
jgi:uncharacterized membrane protein